MKSVLILFTISVFFISCKQSDSGIYIIYAVEKSSYGNDTISSYLKNNLQGTKYDIRFKDKYVSVKSLKTKEEYILPQEQVRLPVPTYSNEFMKKMAEYSITLHRDTSLKMDIHLSIPQEPRTYYNSPIGRVYNDKYGFVTCSMSKLED